MKFGMHPLRQNLNRAILLGVKGIAAFTTHSRWHIAVAVGILLGTSLILAADETAKPVTPSNEAVAPAEHAGAEAPAAVREWASDWSIVHVTAPAEGQGGAIVARAGVAGT